MLSNSQIKFIHSLRLKKYRKVNGCFIAEGKKLLKELLSSKREIHSLYITANEKENILNTYSNLPFPINEISENELKKISQLTTPNECLCIVKIPNTQLNTINDFTQQITLVLDGISDPGNLGTIIRIADWFGLKQIVCSLDSVDAYNPKVVQATMGSIARLEIYYNNLVDLLKDIRTNTQLPVYAAQLDGKSIYQTELNKNGIIVFGNETNGISSSLKPFITESISIPRYGRAESLNVAVATAIICAEFKK